MWKTKLIERAGTWFSYNGERMGQGRENVKNFLLQNPDLQEEISIKIRQALGLIPPDEAEAAETTEAAADA